MNYSFTKKIVLFTMMAALSGCAGTPVQLGSKLNGVQPQGTVREISARACGFQLLLLIPISVNNRQERAYKELEQKAAGDYITDVQVSESWSYGFVGTSYCTTLKANAIRPGV